MAPVWMILAAAALAAHYAMTFGIWLGCLRATGARPTVRQAADTFVPSLLARYVPGKVWSHAVRMALARRAGISLTDVTGAVGWEILLAVTGAGVIALAATHGTGIDARIRLSTALLTAACLGAIVAARILAASSVTPPLLRRWGLTRTADAGMLAQLGLAHMVAWLLYGTSHWAVARAIVPVGIDALPLVTGAVALAWLGGYLSLFTPAGLGVREGLLTLLLAPALGAGPVVLLAAISRVLAIGLEVLLLSAWSGARSGGAPAHGGPAGNGSSQSA